MEIKKFKKFKKYLDEILEQLKDEALKEGQDIFSPEFESVLSQLKRQILAKRGINLVEYNEMEEAMEQEEEKRKAKVEIAIDGKQVDYLTEKFQALTKKEKEEIQQMVEETKEKIEAVKKEINYQDLLNKPEIVSPKVIEDLKNKIPKRFDPSDIYSQITYILSDLTDLENRTRGQKEQIEELSERKIETHPEKHTIDSHDTKATGEQLDRLVGGEMVDDLHKHKFPIPEFPKIIQGRGRPGEKGDKGEPGSTNFLGLTDTPSSYSGQAGKGVRVNTGTDGLEFYTLVDTDEKVKLNVLDPTAGYLDDKITGYGFLTSETDPVFTAWDKSTGISITESQISDFGTYLTASDIDDTAYGEGWDGVIDVAPSKNAVYDKIETLGGGHDVVTLDVNAETLLSLSTQELGLDDQNANVILAGPVSGAATVPTFRSLVADDIPDLSGTYLTSETDPVFTAWDKSTGISITESQISDLQAYLTAEADPVFLAWDKSTGISITESQISDLQSYLLNITGESIGDLSDVDMTGIVNAKILKYNSTSGNWEIADDVNTTYISSDFDHNSLTNTHNLTTNIDHDAITNGGAHDYAYITGNDVGTDITAAELEELTDGSETTLHSHTGNGGASQLSDLSDVGVTTPTDKNALMADGDSWESRALVEADISDFGTYLESESDPIYLASQAANITETDITNLGNLDTAAYQPTTAFAAALGADDNYVTDAEKIVIGNTSGVNTGDQDLSGKANIDQTMYIGTTGVAINRGSGALTLAGITLTTPNIGTPSAGTLTNCTGLPVASVVAGTLVANMEASDHGTAATDELINVCYGTGNPPDANTTTEGSLFVKYTA